jgi:hypothetical protein
MQDISDIRAPVIVHAASNSCRNRSFQPDVHASRKKKAAERTRRLRVKRCGLDYAARPEGRRRFVAFTACVFKDCNIDKLQPDEGRGLCVMENFFDRPLNERRAEFEIRLAQALAARKAKGK